MTSPRRRTHTTGTVMATVLLVVCGGLIGAWVASVYDVLRVSAIDTSLAHRLGYIGEITSASVDPRPHGLTRLMLIAVFIAGLLGGLITYATTVLSRRRLDDQEAIAYTLGWWFLGAAAGFAWLATDWPQVQLGDADGLGIFLHYGSIWMPIALVAIGMLCLLVWWPRSDSVGQPSATVEAAQPSDEREAPA